jgi:activator of HSP90 ATPase
MKTTSFHQTVVFAATPEEVYATLMDSRKHSEFTSAKASIGKYAGDLISAYDGYIVGENMELIPGEKIVQTWRSDEKGWPEDHFSVVIFELHKVKGGTRLKFTHKNVPATKANEIKKGWHEFYWVPLKKKLAGKG